MNNWVHKLYLILKYLLPYRWVYAWWELKTNYFWIYLNPWQTRLQIHISNLQHVKILFNLNKKHLKNYLNKNFKEIINK